MNEIKNNGLTYSYLIKASVYSNLNQFSPNVTGNHSISSNYLDQISFITNYNFIISFWKAAREKHQKILTPSIVAMLGWIIPEPFAIPPMVMVFPPT